MKKLSPGHILRAVEHRGWRIIDAVRNRPTRSYAETYRRHAREHSGADAVGLGDFDLIGRMEVTVLEEAGLRPGHTLVDFGCGSGRLAVQIVPRLGAGQYIGLDVAQELLDRGASLIGRTHPSTSCQVRWIQTEATTYPLGDRSADMICAFSVFTHLEHEDAYRYLVDARRVIRPGGAFVFSCLPLDHQAARDIFLTEASFELDARWNRIRNVCTSQSLMDEISRLAGWRVESWRRGDTAGVVVDGQRHSFGQSVCVLRHA